MAVVLKLVFLVTLVFIIDQCYTDTLTVGTSGQLAFVDSVKLGSIPLKVRTKNVFYSGNKTIKGISAIDRAKSKTTVSITSGGVGFTFTNIRLKSERGEGIDYQVEIYV